MPQIVNTGLLVAYWNRRDQQHPWARNVPVRAPLRTCGPVLMEAASLLGTEEPLLQMLADGDMASSFDIDTHASA